MTTDQHDPIDRKLDEEPHFLLLARDPRAPSFARLYAILRERGPDVTAKAHAAVDALLNANAGIPPNPTKDKEHAWSARAKADEMAQWHRLNMTGKAHSGRISSGPELPRMTLDQVLKPEATFDIGDEIVLTAPVHYRKPRPFRTLTDLSDVGELPADFIGQITSGTRGTIRDLDADTKTLVVAFAEHATQNHAVPFDRARKVE